MVVFTIYLLTVAPTTQFWDTSEYIAAAKVLGIPHPPGNPLFVLLANVWGRLPLAESYALRINLFAAATSAAASGLCYLMAERLAREILPDRRQRFAAAFAGILVAATSFTVWNQSTVNEKVYTVSLFSLALTLWLTMRWADTPPGPRRNRLLVLVIYLLALSSTNHLMGLLAAPAVLIYLFFTDWKVVRRPGVWAAAIGAVAVGLSVNAYLWYRAGHFPPINEGEPTTWQALLDVLSRKQYLKPPVTQRQADLGWQLINYLQYFSWQFTHDFGEKVRIGFAAVFGGLGIAGAWKLLKTDRRAGWAFIAFIVTITLALVFYLNFKYGYSIRPGENLRREVRERDYFFVASFLFWGVFVALGFATIIRLVSTLDRNDSKPGTRMNRILPYGILVLALVPMLGNRLTAPRSDETLARDFAVDLLQSLEPYSILITAGDNDMFPLWYAQEVEGVRRDVILANLSLLNTSWHLRQIQRRPIYPFEPEKSIELFRNRDWPRPVDPPFAATMEQLDRMPQAATVPQRSVVKIGDVRAVLEQGTLRRADIAVLRLIRDNHGKRPVYFARTTGGYPDRLQLTPYLLGYGLARKLTPEEIQPSDSTQFSRVLGWVNVPRTTELLFDVYHHAAAERQRPRGWVDRPSESILSLYGLMYAEFARVLSAGLDTASPDPERLKLVSEGSEIAQRILENTSLARDAIEGN